MSEILTGKSKQKLAYTQGWLSIATNGLLFIFKYWAGFVTGRDRLAHGAGPRRGWRDWLLR